MANALGMSAYYGRCGRWLSWLVANCNASLCERSSPPVGSYSPFPNAKQWAREFCGKLKQRPLVENSTHLLASVEVKPSET